MKCGTYRPIKISIKFTRISFCMIFERTIKYDKQLAKEKIDIWIYSYRNGWKLIRILKLMGLEGCVQMAVLKRDSDLIMNRWALKFSSRSESVVFESIFDQFSNRGKITIFLIVVTANWNWSTFIYFCSLYGYWEAHWVLIVKRTKE